MFEYKLVKEKTEVCRFTSNIMPIVCYCPDSFRKLTKQAYTEYRKMCVENGQPMPIRLSGFSIMPVNY